MAKFFIMPSVSVILILFALLNVGLLQGTGSGSNGNRIGCDYLFACDVAAPTYGEQDGVRAEQLISCSALITVRLCIVEGRGSYKRAPRYCPVLDAENSPVECVIGTDRLDCLRRISKGTVDFSVFSPEDLVAAQWVNTDVLVTNEIRHRDRPFERSVVAVVNRRILPSGSSTLHAVLRNSTLCHPGVGADDIRPLSDTLSGYLESLVLERSCDPALSLTENRIKALARYFGKACKAGPWIVDKARDAELKRKYPSLCAACFSPSKCDSNDRFWGDIGALNCLGEGSGDVTWAEYDDVSSYFGLNNATRRSSYSYPSTEQFMFLCRDGTWQPLTGQPCVWLHRPWNVILAKRKAAAAVSKLAQSLTNSSVVVDQHWQGALAALLESSLALREPLIATPPPGDYLAKAKGFREAYSQTGCDPPRHITFCTTSLIEKNKCDWLSEAGAVYGISPPLQCVVRNGTEECMNAVRNGDSDIVVGGSDWLVKGKRNYGVYPVLHEVTPIVQKTNTIYAYTRKSSQITNMADLRGKRVAFPRYDGWQWHSVMSYITEKEKISCKEFVTDYFQEICAPGAEGKFENGNVKNCYEDGEEGALKSILDGNSDVVFLSQQVSILDDLVQLCPNENKMYCFIGWSSIGHVFASQNLTAMRRQEIINVLGHLDQMFGKHPPFHTPMFSMYGPFNHQLDVLFHNNTRTLARDSIFTMHPYASLPFSFDRMFLNSTDLSCSFGGKSTPSLLVLVVTLVAVIFSF